VALLLPFVAGALTPGLLDLGSRRSSAELTEQTKGELELLRQDLQEPNRVRAFTADGRTHRRIYTEASDGTLHLGRTSHFLEFRPSPAEEDTEDARRDRRGYFLDPWNNAYWVYASRRQETAILYSFGANRRRDTDFRELSEEAFREAALDGDDIGVALSLRQPGGDSGRVEAQ
jgi:hypothetical protein